jgi:pimeloyl-ACP methyl ester carboxylesterase
LEWNDVSLAGDLTIPAACAGIVLFAHGSGSSRHSPRNQFVARELNQGGLGTLLFDLLTEKEERIDAITAELRFNIPLLAERLTKAIDWTCSRLRLEKPRIGLFGASTGAAAALVAAADRPEEVKAVVSRGGRPDLARQSLARVKAPTLLIVGQLDETVIELNEWARSQMTAETELEIVPGASHLFEEPGTLARAALLARNWFATHVPDHRFAPA